MHIRALLSAWRSTNGDAPLTLTCDLRLGPAKELNNPAPIPETQNAKCKNQNAYEIRQVTHLGYLAPDIITAIVDGTQPVDLTGRKILRIGIVVYEIDHDQPCVYAHPSQPMQMCQAIGKLIKQNLSLCSLWPWRSTVHHAHFRPLALRSMFEELQ